MKWSRMELLQAKDATIEFDEMIRFEPEVFSKMHQIRGLQDVTVSGNVHYEASSERVFADLDIEGVMIVPCSITLEDVEYDLRGKGYNDLPEELKEKFDNFTIDVVKHLDCTDEEIGYHIRRYNRQSSMNNNETSVTYMDAIAKEVKDISLKIVVNLRQVKNRTELANGLFVNH